jgi:hypothetical protein
LSSTKGSWVEFIEFDGKKYWDIEVISPAELISANKTLPSDCRFREDLIFLAEKDLNLA